MGSAVAVAVAVELAVAVAVGVAIAVAVAVGLAVAVAVDMAVELAVAIAVGLAVAVAVIAEYRCAEATGAKTKTTIALKAKRNKILFMMHPFTRVGCPLGAAPTFPCSDIVSTSYDLSQPIPSPRPYSPRLGMIEGRINTLDGLLLPASTQTRLISVSISLKDPQAFPS